MATKVFDREAMVRWYVDRHFEVDPGITQILYLPTNAPPTEIRLIEVNKLVIEREAGPFEPIDFGVDIGTNSGHTLVVLDVTPKQWEQIRNKEIPLPDNWSLAGMQPFFSQSSQKIS